MYLQKTILAFIGARKGSKGLKNKNILSLAGKPLISWTIQASLGSKYVDDTLVSTDGEKIARIAKDAGAKVPFLRPVGLATDKSVIEDAVRHALDWIKENNKKKYDYLLLLQPTSPLRTAQHIDTAIEYYFRYRQTNHDTLISVTKAPAKCGWLMEKNPKGYLKLCFGNKGKKHRRQDIPEYYLPNGLIYLAPTPVICRRNFNSSSSMPFVMDEKVSIDIDSREDFKQASKILSLRMVRSQKSK